MVTIYQLRNDKEHIAKVQRATLNTEKFGIQQTHGLFGSPEWWSKIDSGELPIHRLRGTITKVYMGSMNDWPEFAMRADTGEDSSWSRYADSKELAEFYTVGHRIELDYVIQHFKPKSWSGDSENKVVIEIRVGSTAP
jgi:hypothetical protein